MIEINQSHWHLLLNHFPIILSIIGTSFLLFSIILKKQFLKTGGLILIILAAVFAFPAFETGENAEESVEEINGISHELIHTHEETAEIGYKIILGAGILAFISLLFGERKNKFATIFFILTCLTSIVSAGYLSYVGKTGGAIRHPEISNNIQETKNEIEIMDA